MNINRLSYLMGCVLALSLMLTIPACNENDYIPKPRGYFRINFPGKEYRSFDTTCPYTFEYPKYAVIKPDPNVSADLCWYNIDFPAFRGTLYLSYKPVNHNVSEYFEDSRNFVTKHIPKADDIAATEYHNDSANVHGLIYDIKGTNVASVYQFCVTDSSRHFLRGALYFYAAPNNDSLAPVLDFIRQDIDHLLSTLRWKNTK